MYNFIISAPQMIDPLELNDVRVDQLESELNQASNNTILELTVVNFSA